MKALFATRHAHIETLAQRYLEELESYQIYLRKSKNRDDRALSNQFWAHKPEYARRLLELYLDRCRLHYHIEFFKYRGGRPNAQTSQLSQLVDSQKFQLLEILEFIQNLQIQVRKGTSIDDIHLEALRPPKQKLEPFNNEQKSHIPN